MPGFNAEPSGSWDGAFVIGTGRCGSTLISRALALHPDILSLSEFFFNLAPEAFPAGLISGEELWHMLSSRSEMANALLEIKAELAEFLYPIDGGHRFDRAGGVPRIATVTLPFLDNDPDALFDQLAETVLTFAKQTAAQQYLQLFSLLGSWMNRSRWVERSGASGFFSDQLLANFPTARYVHLTRDLDATARSMNRHSAFRLIALWMEFINRCGCDVLNGDRPTGSIPPDLEDLVPGRFSKESFDRWDPGVDSFRQMASFEVDCIRVTLDALPADQVLVLSYEDIVDKPVIEFGRLAEFFDLDDPASWARQAAGLVRR
jgi:Sulfotransferase family